MAKIQPFNLDGQRGKTRSHYLLVRGSEIDVRMEIICVGWCIIETEPLTTENEVSTWRRFLLMIFLVIHNN